MAEINRSELRKIIMTALYQMSVYDANKIEYEPKAVIKELLEVENDFVNEIVFGVLNNKDQIDKKANKYLKDWTIDRLDLTGGAILRMAIYEIKYMDTPNIVVINEALELAKKYSDDAVRKMINACLDRIINE